MKKEECFMRPEWIRPSQVREIFGIGRTKLYALMDAGEILSKSLKEPGQRAATRLVSYNSVAQFVENLPS